MMLQVSKQFSESLKRPVSLLRRERGNTSTRESTKQIFTVSRFASLQNTKHRHFLCHAHRRVSTVVPCSDESFPSVVQHNFPSSQGKSTGRLLKGKAGTCLLKLLASVSQTGQRSENKMLQDKVTSFLVEKGNCRQGNQPLS